MKFGWTVIVLFFGVFFKIVYYLPVLSSPTPNLETEISGIMIRSWTALMKIKS